MMFSVITPTWNRLDGRLQRCLKSVRDQTCQDFEHIVVNDGSSDGTEEYLNALLDGGALWWPNLAVLTKKHEGRVIARNAGMRAAEGEWICHIDSDDAWDPMYLETFAWFIDKQPEVNLWVCGAVVHGVVSGGPKDRYGGQTVPHYTKLRKAWIPPLDETGEKIHALFDSGKVGTGMFVFRKECLEVTGWLPDEWLNHNYIADGFDEYLGLEPGTTGYGTAGPPTRPKGLLGNPFGEDHALYQCLCLHFKAHVIGEEAARGPCLYVHYIR